MPEQVDPTRLQSTLHFLLQVGFHPALGMESVVPGLEPAGAHAAAGVGPALDQAHMAALRMLACAARDFLVKLLTSSKGDKLPSVRAAQTPFRFGLIIMLMFT